MFALVSWLALVGFTQATPEIIERNLAYRSPYLSHPTLGIDTVNVHQRHLAAREEIRGLRKRQAQTDVPDGKPDAYPTPGYGLGVTDWTDTDMIYAGDLNFTHSVASGKL